MLPWPLMSAADTVWHLNSGLMGRLRTVRRMDWRTGVSATMASSDSPPRCYPHRILRQWSVRRQLKEGKERDWVLFSLLASQIENPIFKKMKEIWMKWHSIFICLYLVLVIFHGYWLQNGQSRAWQRKKKKGSEMTNLSLWINHFKWVMFFRRELTGDLAGRTKSVKKSIVKRLNCYFLKSRSQINRTSIVTGPKV